MGCVPNYYQISIMWSRGSQSIYDRLLQLRVVYFGKDTQHHEVAPWRWIGAILSTAVMSMLLVILLQEAKYPRLMMAKMHPLFAQMMQKQQVLIREMFHYFDAQALKKQETVFEEPAKELLIRSGIMKDIRKFGVGTVRLLSDRKLKDSVIIPANSAVSWIEVNVNGREVRKPKEFSSTIRDIIEQGKLPYKYLDISLHRDAIFGMFNLSLRTDCYFQKGEGKLLGCTGEWAYGMVW